jgi:hypothetical protein
MDWATVFLLAVLAWLAHRLLLSDDRAPSSPSPPGSTRHGSATDGATAAAPAEDGVFHCAASPGLTVAFSATDDAVSCDDFCNRVEGSGGADCVAACDTSAGSRCDCLESSNASVHCSRRMYSKLCTCRRRLAPVAAVVDLHGYWRSNNFYGDGRDEVVHVTTSNGGNTWVATKVIGDGNVPAGVSEGVSEWRVGGRVGGWGSREETVGCRKCVRRTSGATPVHQSTSRRLHATHPHARTQMGTPPPIRHARDSIQVQSWMTLAGPPGGGRHAHHPDPAPTEAAQAAARAAGGVAVGTDLDVLVQARADPGGSPTAYVLLSMLLRARSPFHLQLVDPATGKVRGDFRRHFVIGGGEGVVVSSRISRKWSSRSSSSISSSDDDGLGNGEDDGGFGFGDGEDNGDDDDDDVRRSSAFATRGSSLVGGVARCQGNGHWCVPCVTREV